MKNLFTVVAFACSTLIASAQVDSRVASSSSGFGRFGSDCSSGRGTCSFTIGRSEHSRPSDAQVVEKMTANSFQLTIKRSSLTASDELRIAGRALNQLPKGEPCVFLQDESLAVDKESLVNLNLNPYYNRILAGNYSMYVTTDNVIITINLAH